MSRYESVRFCIERNRFPDAFNCFYSFILLLIALIFRLRFSFDHTNPSYVGISPILEYQLSLKISSQCFLGDKIIHPILLKDSLNFFF